MPGPDDDRGGVKPVQNYEPARRHVGTGPDSDGDGLSDDFETNVFGSDPKEKDIDGDGLNDYAEWWLDTKPRDNDSDGDGWLDGEDLAFGDPLRWNDGGVDRTELRERARRQFDAEGSDQDKDWLRDPIERDERTKADNPDSDNDGLGDGVEIQLRNSGVTTSQDSTPDDTTDLDAARERLGEQRAVSDAPPQSSSASAEGASEFAASDPLSSEVLATPSYEEPSYSEPAYSEPAADDVADVAYADAPNDVAGDSWA